MLFRSVYVVIPWSGRGDEKWGNHRICGVLEHIKRRARSCTWVAEQGAKDRASKTKGVKEARREASKDGRTKQLHPAAEEEHLRHKMLWIVPMNSTTLAVNSAAPAVKKLLKPDLKTERSSPHPQWPMLRRRGFTSALCFYYYFYSETYLLSSEFSFLIIFWIISFSI